jgi:hypothetical protein
MVIVDEPPHADKIHRHVLPNGEVHEGILTFWKEGEIWYYEGHTNKPTPDVCFTIKYPLANLESLTWPDLSSIKEQISKESAEKYKDIEEDGPVYVSHFLSNYLECESIKSSSTINLENESFGLKPLIYIRLSKNVKVTYPCFNLEQFYKVGSVLSSGHGFTLEVEPNLTFEKNDKLIE